MTVNKTELKVGETTTAKAVITPDNATDQTVSWTTSDESVITVDKDGQITAKKNGKANVIATASNGKTDKVEITVVEEKTDPKPDNGDDGKDNQNQTQNTKPEEDKKKDPVKTGDPQSIVLCLGAMVAAGVTVIGRKKKRD